MHEVFEHGSDDAKARLKTVGGIIDKNTTFIKVYENGKDFYQTGNEKIADKTLMASAKGIGNNAFASNKKYEVYYYSEEFKGNEYELYLFSSNNHRDNTKAKTVACCLWSRHNFRRTRFG